MTRTYIVLMMPESTDKVKRIPLEWINARNSRMARLEASARYRNAGMIGTLSLTRWAAAKLGARLIRASGVRIKRPARRIPREIAIAATFPRPRG